MLQSLINEREEKFEEIVKLFNNEILPKGVERVNEGVFKLMSAKLPSEQLPTNQRNLTDARTRIGTLLEYTLAVEVNHLLKNEYKLEAYDVGFVLANQYPDLVIRNENHEAVIRLEVKSIQGISEEKSANFDALVRNVRQNADLLCIMLWEWETIKEKKVLVDFPKIHKVYAFNAHDITRIRDEGWLGNITNDIGMKLVDISGVYVPSNVDGQVVYKEEEGNLGKLLRIDTESQTVKELQGNYTTVDYTSFKKQVVLFGLIQVSMNCLKSFGSDEEPLSLVNESDFSSDQANLLYYAYRSIDDTHLLIIGGNRQKKAQIKELSKSIADIYETKTLKVLVFNDKFKWDFYSYDGSLKKDKDGNKPEYAYEELAPLS